MRRRLAARDAAPIVELVVDGLAAYRLTKLLVADSITAPTRARIVERVYRAEARRRHVAVSDLIGQSVHPMGSDDWLDLVVLEGSDAPKLATLVSCQLCAGVWVAAVVVAARRTVPGWPYIARGLAVAAVGQLVVTAQR